MRTLAFAALLTVGSCSSDLCEPLDGLTSVDDLPKPASCPAPPTPRDLSAHAKLAVAVFHFNLQYVAGGVRGFPDGSIDPVFDLDEAATEDSIIKVSFEPLLDALLTHPTLAVDLELQAYMLEVMALRHPLVLDKLRTLAARGQVDVDSFHYSDQLYIAYPRLDLERSLELSDRVFVATCIPRGKSIFTQEGQFARGQLGLAQNRGYSTSILPKNLYAYQFGERPSDVPTLFVDSAVPDHVVILGGRGFARTATPATSLTWTFMDDGEIAFTKDRLNPYFGHDFEHDPAKLDEYVQELLALESEGYVMATVHEATRALLARGVVPEPLPPVLDGTWQPKDTNNVFRWMGGSGLFRTTERDSDVLARIIRARNAVAAVDALGPSADPRARRGLERAWREAVLAQVSDSTGWNPFKNEVDYSLAHAANAEHFAAATAACLELTPASVETPNCTPSDRTLEQLGISLDIPNRNPKVTVETCASLPGSVSRVSLEVTSVATSESFVDSTEDEKLSRQLELRAHLSGAEFSVAPALEDEVRTYSLDDYIFDDIGIPLQDGLIGLGSGRWLIQDLSSGRVAAIVSRSGELREWVRFLDMTVSRTHASTRRYYVAESLDASSALALARAINRPSAP
ncbi:MAG: hypothetical protein HY791_01785 [Deltaproteobacteria bacterium]|nr:hypothetical protein [Deltaproteobacteria bacterium]